jgi:ABC-2 type transport system permease protein
MQQNLDQRTLHTTLYEGIIKPLCSWSVMIFALICPLFTTNAFSQEYRQNTFCLFASSSYSATKIVLGKFFSIFSLLLIILAFMLVMIASLNIETTLDWQAIALALLTMGLVGGAFISFGLFISSLIDYPLLSIGVTFLGNTLWMLLEWLNPFPKEWDFLARSLSLLNHSYHALNGILYTPDLFYYVIFIVLWLSLTQRNINHKMSHVPR